MVSYGFLFQVPTAQQETSNMAIGWRLLCSEFLDSKPVLNERGASLVEYFISIPNHDQAQGTNIQSDQRLVAIVATNSFKIRSPFVAQWIDFRAENRTNGHITKAECGPGGNLWWNSAEHCDFNCDSIRKVFGFWMFLVNVLYPSKKGPVAYSIYPSHMVVSWRLPKICMGYTNLFWES